MKNDLEINSATLLLIDDDQISRMLICEIFAGPNYTILEAGSGRAAIELLLKHLDEIDLILLDIKLPDCGGWELVKKIRKIKEYIPFIAVSAIGARELAEMTKKLNLEAYFNKPYNIESLVMTVKALIKMQKLTKVLH